MTRKAVGVWCWTEIKIDIAGFPRYANEKNIREKGLYQNIPFESLDTRWSKPKCFVCFEKCMQLGTCSFFYPAKREKRNWAINRNLTNPELIYN